MSILKELQEFLTEDPWSDELPEQWEVLEDGDWCDNHKSEAKSDIIKHLPSGKIFQADFYRTGDYWQGYETELTDVCEVEPYQVLVIKYKAVKP